MSVTVSERLRLAEVTTQERDIPPVALKRHVKNVADERHRSEYSIDDDVAGHPRQNALRRPQSMGLQEHPESDRQGSRIANARNKTDDAIQPEPPAGSRNTEARVQKIRKRVKPLQLRFVGVEAGAGLRRLLLSLRGQPVPPNAGNRTIGRGAIAWR